MFVKALLIGLLTSFCGGVVVEVLCWSFYSCAPLLGGTIVGLILGDARAGMIIGANIQLVYMGQIIVGGVPASDYAIAGCVATALTMLTNQPPEMGITIAVSLGFLGLLARNARMTVNSIWVHKADKAAAEGNTRKIFFYNTICPQFINLLVYAVPAFLAVYFGAEYFQQFLDILPEFVLTGLQAVGKLLPALGIALLLKSIFNAKFVPFFLIGFVFSSYLKLDIIAIALLGASFAMLYWHMNKKNEEAA